VRGENDVSTLNSITPVFSKFEIFYYIRLLYLFIIKIHIEMIPTENSQNEQWDLFENAATHSYARSILERNKNKDPSSPEDEKPRRTSTMTEYVYFFINLMILIILLIVSIDQKQRLMNNKR
jgi:hypothetical protein